MLRRSCRTRISDQIKTRRLLVSCCPTSFWRTKAVRRGEDCKMLKIDAAMSSLYSLERQILILVWDSFFSDCLVN